MGADLVATGVRKPHPKISALLAELANQDCWDVLQRELKRNPLTEGVASRWVNWTHADCPMPTAELVTVHTAFEEAPGIPNQKGSFAVYTKLDADVPSPLKRWRKEADGADRHLISHDAVIVDAVDICAGLGAPRVVLIDRDVTRLVMSAATFEEQARLREQGLAKLSRAEREALGLGGV